MRHSAPQYLATPVASREESRRRLLLLSIGIVMLLSTGPVFGHHLATGAQTLLHGRDRLGELCLVALHLVLAPVHGGFHILVTAGIAYALLDRARAWRRMQRVLQSLELARPIPGDMFSIAAVNARLDPRILHVAAGLQNPAFTTGWLRPRVFVAQELADVLTLAELTAVLRHERAHVERRDPLRLSVLRLFGRILFWMPAMMRLSDDMADEAEVEADDRAAAGEPLVLASAILSLAQWTPRSGAASLSLHGAAGFLRHDMVDRRVRRLAGEDVPAHTHVTRRSIAGATATMLLVLVSGVLMSHPLSAETGAMGGMDHGHHGHGVARDCNGHAGPAILHIFCPGMSLGRISNPCPHFASARRA